MLVALHVEIEIVRYKKIEVPVAVKIDPCCARAPTRIIDTSLRGDISERAIAIIVVQNVAAKICDVQVLESVVIVIPDGDSHPVTDVADAGLLRDIFELKLSGLAQQIPEQPIAGLPSGRGRKLRTARILSRIERRALQQIDVQIAIVVVIEERNARPHDFWHQEVTGCAGEMAELEADFLSHFAKQRNS